MNGAVPHREVGDPVEPLRQARQYHSLRAWVKAIDLAAYREIRRLAHRPERVALVRRYSSLGEHGLLWAGIGAAGALWGADDARPRWRRALITVAAAHAASSTIKVAIGRRRPAVEDLPHLMATPTGLSFPSSHATSSFAAARAYGRLLPGPPLYALAVSMAFTRLYLGVHYPSDVVAGAALGTVVGSLAR